MAIKKIVAPGTSLNIVQTDEDFVIPNSFPRPDVVIATVSGIAITLPNDKDVGTSILVVADTRHRVFVITDTAVRGGGGAVAQGPSQIPVHSGTSRSFTSTPSGVWGTGGGVGPAGSAGNSVIGPQGPPGPVGPAGSAGALIGIDSVEVVGDVPIGQAAQLLLQINYPFTIGTEIITVLVTFSAFSSVGGNTLNLFVEVNGTLIRGAEISFDGNNKGESGSISFQVSIPSGPNTVHLFAIANGPGVAINQGSRPTKDHAALNVFRSTP